jgi:SAM-dependent methyltransferase
VRTHERDTARRTESTSEWFANWFDSEHYHRLYANRGDEEAACFIDRLIERRHLAADETLLDLGCGSGRHARHLAAKGFDVTGLDLSAESLELAGRHEGPNLRFVRQDMRLPFQTGIFDHVLNLFTSFGYFDDPADDVTVVHNIASALKPGGTLVLDYLNVVRAEAHLTPEESTVREGLTYRLTRWTDAGHIFKGIAFDDSGGGSVEHVERVAKLTLEDFRFIFELCALRIEAVYGDYLLSPFDETCSPRLMFVASKANGRAPSGAPGLSAREAFSDAADGLRRHAQVGREHRLGDAKGDRRIDLQELEVALLR